MKKIVSIVLALILLLSITATAFAAGKLNVDNESFIVLTSFWNYGYCYAKVSNVGDKPIKVNAAVFEIYDTNGDPISSSDFMSAYPEYLQPGESAYIALNAELNDDQVPLVNDYSLTVTGKSGNSTTVHRLPTTVDFELDVVDGWWKYNYLSATVTNDTEDTVFGITVALVLLDAEGNVLFVTEDTLYEGLTPGSSVVFREDVSSSYLEYYANKGVEIVAWDAIAFIEN